MKSSIFGAVLFSCVAMIGFAFPAQTHAATLSFSAPASVSVGQTFNVNVYINSTDQAFNAAQAAISFPSKLVEVESIDSSSAATVFNFWLGYPAFLNTDGIATFSGGTVDATSGSNVPVLTLKMRAIATGDAVIYAKDASINASDGSGTNLLKEITPTRITIQPKTTTLPAATQTPAITQTPAPATPSIPAAPAVSQPPVSTSTSIAAKTAQAPGPEACSAIFGTCTLRFPTISSVSVEQHVSGGANILASGVAPDGDVVHLTLLQDGVPYENETVVLKGTAWQARLSNITAYGTFELEAWAESADGTQHSETFVWPNILVYPPYTFQIFGYAVHWYTLVSVLLILLTSVLGTVLLWRHTVQQRGWSVSPLAITFGGTAIVTLVMLGISAALWQQQHVAPVHYWKGTTVPCLSHSHAANDHGFAHLSIFIDGVQQQIPAGIGISPSCTADIHTHDDTGRLHLHLHPNAPRATLADFFAVAGEPLVRQGYQLLVMINGENYTNQVQSYELQNGDEVVVSYTPLTTATSTK